MQKILDILNYPDGTPIDAVQGRITAVYPSKTIAGRNGPVTVQNAELSDVGGNKIKLVVWDHPDLAPLKDKEYVLHNTSSKKAYPGIQVKIGSYVANKAGKNHQVGDTVKTFELKVSKEGCFQHIEVFNQSKSPDKASAEPASRPAAAQTGGQVGGSSQGGYINGASVGMAINNAVKIITEGEGYNPELFAKQLYVIASDIIRVSQHMEKGNLHVVGAELKTVGAKPEAAKQPPVAPPVEDVPEDDVPF